MLTDSNSSVLSLSASDHEFDSITKWLSWPLEGGLVNVPGLVETVVAVPEDDVSVMSIVSTMNIEAFTSIVSDVSSGSVVPCDSLVDLSSPLSDGSCNTDSVSLTLLVGNDEVSSGPSSDSSSS